MKVCIYSVKAYEKPFLLEHKPDNLEVVLLQDQLDKTSVSKCQGCEVISIFSRDKCTREIIDILADIGVKLICLRSAGYDNIDYQYAYQAGIKVARVPSYSPEAIAEHAVMMILALSRSVCKADRLVKSYNFKMDSLVGFNLQDKTVGVIGTGNIGQSFMKILNGFNSNVIAYDINPSEELHETLAFQYVDLETLLSQSDIISLHIPLNKETEYIINEESISRMKDGVVIINTSRGKHIDTNALLNGLKSNKISKAGLDVYENEALYFFEDRSLDDNIEQPLMDLINNDDVLITGHQAYLTETALSNIAKITFDNILDYQQGIVTDNFLS